MCGPSSLIPGEINSRLSSHRIVFLAPGSGLGHLVRAAALAIEIKESGIQCTILTTSIFGAGFGELTGLDVITLPPSRWAPFVFHFLNKISPCAVILDTFPFGFRGEDLTSLSDHFPFIYLARRLMIRDYLEKQKKTWDTSSPLVENTIIIEDLKDDHLSLIEKSRGTRTCIDGRIRFDYRSISNPPVPMGLKKKIEDPNLHLVVHSGPIHEVKELATFAESEIRAMGRGNLAVISPLFHEAGRQDGFDYFPASALYGNAYRIYTGAGYNACAEATINPEKHRFIAFPRRYDDQKARLETMKVTAKRQDGNTQAVQFICAFLFRFLHELI